MTEPDVITVRKAAQAKEFIPVETTLLTQRPTAGFEQAVEAGRSRLSEDREQEFLMAVDITRARSARIRPLASHAAADASVAEHIEAAPAKLPDPIDFGLLPSEVIEQVPDTPKGRIERWQAKLLDLSLRNRLLNFKPSKQTVPCLVPDVGALEDALAADKAFRAYPLMEDDPIGERQLSRQERDAIINSATEDAFNRGQITMPLDRKDADNRLLALFRKAKSDLQEGGTNTLFLAAGFLRWQREGEKRSYRAPLLLIPIKLERKSARSDFRILHHEDEVRFNSTLLEFLKRDFDLTLPELEGELPRDDSGIDLPRIFEWMRQRVRDVPGFEVVEEIAISTFSFSKYLMWKDLVERTDQLRNNRLVAHLVDNPDKTFEGGAGDAIPAEQMDHRLAPKDLVTPLPADSSQLSAVVAAAEGRDFVLIGPPGTGKSQTIANIICQCLAHGKTVLFVAEKAAALDVVQRRLEAHGLGDAVLELHSNKTDRKRVLTQLGRGWDRASATSEQDWLDITEKLRIKRDQLNTYASRLGLWGQGPEYPFPSRDRFVSAMEAGGVAAMEVVARDLKALGLYTARALSFEGVEYDILEHTLTPDQVELYDTYAKAFKVIHSNLTAALEATGITNTGSEGAAKAAGAARSAAISAFESTKQRFFNHLLQGLKAPSVIEQLRNDIEVGWAPVVQIVSTGEALLKRRLETLDPDEDLTAGALTPREYVVSYLERAFPVTQHVLIEQEDGSVLSQPLRDQDGQLVISREAKALRDAALEEIMLLAAVPSALDQIIWAFGPEIVTEVTGRNQRPVKDDAGNLRIERRGASANSAETKAFMSGDKVVLIFSDAGGTGRSYHAAQSAKNQARRRHYLLEPGWRADAAIQGLGRTHRAAQVSAPFLRVCTSDVHGEKRFTSTIARRLDTLGALTKGQRETASQGMFRASDNLESSIARGCLRSLYGDLVRGESPAMSYDEFTNWTGLKLSTPEGVMLEELPPIQRFLNRVLALPIVMQNAIFAEFMEKIELATERALAAGTLDVGLETLRGDRITARAAQELRACDKTGAITSLVPLTIENRMFYRSAGTVLEDHPNLSPMRNASSGNVAMVSKRPRQVYGDEGEMVLERRMVRPAKNRFLIEEAYVRSAWEPVAASTFKTLWDAEVAQLPETETQQLHLLTGLILPIWTEIPGDNTRIYRVQPENGSALLGRAIDETQAAALRGKFMNLDAATPTDMLCIALDTDQAVDLGGGISLKRRRVAGRQRLELTGVSKDSLPWLKSLGCFTEIHQYQLRVFLPIKPEYQAQRILTAIQTIHVADKPVGIAAE